MVDPVLLREQTADVHRRVEDAVDLPGSVRSRDDYVALLGRLYDLHAPLERRLALRAWSPCWDELGIALETHRRTHLLEDDLDRLGAPAVARDVPVPPLEAFGEALGCLYVLEGSAIGGRVLAPALRAAVGGVPAFFAGGGRSRARAWQSLHAAVRRADDGLTGDVLRGACADFAAFDSHLEGSGSAVDRLSLP